MEYELIRSKRKTVEIKVDIHGNVIVKAPLNVSDKYIDNFVISKEDWIISAKEKMAKQKEAFHSYHFDFIRFLGNSYRVENADIKALKFNGKKFLMPEGKNAEEKRKLISSWYKKQARKIFLERLEVLTQATGTSYTKLRISGAKTRWGRCTDKGVISLSWKLIMAQGRAIDYVILHELAHTIEMNHSDDFWNIVEGWVPNYKNIKEYLKDFSFKIDSEGWNS